MNTAFASRGPTLIPTGFDERWAPSEPSWRPAEEGAELARRAASTAKTIPLGIRFDPGEVEAVPTPVRRAPRTRLDTRHLWAGGVLLGAVVLALCTALAITWATPREPEGPPPGGIFVVEMG